MAESSVKNRALYSKYDSDEEDEVDNDVDLGFSLKSLSFTQKNAMKKLLVMNLGGFLCHRIFCYAKSKVLTYRSPDASYWSYHVYRRPYCEEFMKFCFEKFEVVIWSSANERNMNDAVNSIVKGMKSKLLFSWDQDECTWTTFKDLENPKKPIFLKELKKLWGKKGAQILGLSTEFSSSNTLFIDTNPYKSLLNPRHNAIFLSEYKANHLNDKVFEAGSELRNYLEKVAEAEDIPSFVKENPFGEPAISPQHTDWTFYSKIIDKYHK